MAEPTVFEMEIEGVVHPIEDRTARTELEKLVTYSTTEQDTGKTWNDGKKIYRRSFSLSTTTYQDVGASRRIFSLDIPVTGYNKIVSCNGTVTVSPLGFTPTMLLSLGGVWVDGNMTPYIASTLMIQGGSGMGIAVYANNTSGVTRADAEVTVEYTKSE